MNHRNLTRKNARHDGNQLASIARETLQLFSNSGNLFTAISDLTQASTLHSYSMFHGSGSVPPILLAPALKQTAISVEYGDSLQIAQKYLHEVPCVLNMASCFRPGGGWLNGATAQEEMLCYRSGLFKSLQLFANRYPLADYDAIYSRNVPVVRDIEMRLYRRGSHYEMSFISIAALCQPDLIHGCLRPDDAKRTEEKIRTMLRVPHLHNHQTLILGAFGCGAYGNPPHQTARLFRNVLSEPEFAGAFDKIVFAILDNSRTDNFKVFSDILV